MKVRIKFRKYGALKFIGHLDVMRYFQKAMRRAQIPVAFTSGYSPHMIMSFASPLGIGLTSAGEYFDIELTRPISSREAVERLNAVGVEGIEVISFRQIPEDRKSSGMAIVAAADYLVYHKESMFPEAWKGLEQQFLAEPAVMVWKKTKRSEKEVDILPMIYRLEMQDRGIFMQVAAGSEQNLKPGLVMKAFCEFAGGVFQEAKYQFHRLEMYADTGRKERRLVSLESLGTEILNP